MVKASATVSMVHRALSMVPEALITPPLPLSMVVQALTGDRPFLSMGLWAHRTVQEAHHHMGLQTLSSCNALGNSFIIQMASNL